MERDNNEGNPKIKGSKLQSKFNYFPMECLCFLKFSLGFYFYFFFKFSSVFSLTFFYLCFHLDLLIYYDKKLILLSWMLLSLCVSIFSFFFASTFEE